LDSLGALSNTEDAVGVGHLGYLVDVPAGFVLSRSLRS
jgi:hypothetical protein